MTEPSDKTEKSLVPIPYSVLGAGWLVLLVGSTSLLPSFLWLALLAGPAVMAAKFFDDAERFARMKENPPPKEYKFHAEGVYDAVDQALKTLPGYFDGTTVTQPFRNVNPQKGMPMHVEYSITRKHEDENNKHQKPSDMKSNLYMKAFIARMGNNSMLTVQFKCTGRRLELEEMIDHIMGTIDGLVQQHMK